MNIVWASQYSNLHKSAYDIFCSSRPSNTWSFGTFSKSLSTSYSLMALNSCDSVMGFVVTSSIFDELEIEDICVSSKFKKGGVATEMLDKLIFTARSNSIHRIILEVAENNVPALSLYEKFAFQRSGKRKNYYVFDGDRKVDAILMELIIQ